MRPFSNCPSGSAYWTVSKGLDRFLALVGALSILSPRIYAAVLALPRRLKRSHRRLSICRIAVLRPLTSLPLMKFQTPEPRCVVARSGAG
jgi:hypothetical protein